MIQIQNLISFVSKWKFEIFLTAFHYNGTRLLFIFSTFAYFEIHD
mgnify:CR=1 FL=1